MGLSKALNIRVMSPLLRRVSHFFSTVLVVTLLFAAPEAFAVSSGPNNGSTFVDDASTGTEIWLNPGNAQSSDNSYATVSLLGPSICACLPGAHPTYAALPFLTKVGHRLSEFLIPVVEAVGNPTFSHYLKATGFGFSIPSGATINGIVVEVERKASANTASNTIVDTSVRIVKGGALGVNDDKATAGGWPTTDAYATYGGSTDLWLETWTPTDINATNFGAAIAAEEVCTGTTAVTASVDHIRITVSYTPAAAAPTETPVSGTRSPSGSAAYAAPGLY